MRAETLHSLDVLQDFGDNTQGHPRVWRVPRLPPAAGSAPPPGGVCGALCVLDDDAFLDMSGSATFRHGNEAACSDEDHSGTPHS